MPRLLRHYAVILTAAIAVAAHAADAPAVTVVMTVKRQFVPAKVTIRAGQTVEWVSADPQNGHRITTNPAAVEDRSLVSIPKGAKPFTSRTIHAGESFQYRFSVPGTYRYACPPHEADRMKGEIEVLP